MTNGVPFVVGGVLKEIEECCREHSSKQRSRRIKENAGEREYAEMWKKVQE